MSELLHGTVALLFTDVEGSTELQRLLGVRIGWANLDVDLMRNDPPWAPFETPARRDFVSQSFGCFVYVPALGAVDLVAACKK